MANTELLKKLRDLHEELLAINEGVNSIDLVDEETIDELGKIVTDVSELIDQANAIETPKNEPQDLTDRILMIESRHPRLTRFLSQVTDLLAMIGI